MYNKKQIYMALTEDAPHLLQNELQQLPGKLHLQWPAHQLELLLKKGEEYLLTPLPQITYSIFKVYWITGSNKEYGDVFKEYPERLTVLALLCTVYPRDKRWKYALEDTIWAICALPFWSPPCTMLNPVDDSIMDFDDFEGNIDLNASQMALTLAEILEMCGDQLDHDVIQRAELELERRIFTPFTSPRLYRWELMNNNWCAVCSGCIAGAAMYLIRDRSRLTDIIYRGLSSVDIYINSFDEDGVCVEGANYWTYGFGHLVIFADLLKKRTGGRLDLFTLPIVGKIAETQRYFYLHENKALSFSDCDLTAAFSMGISCYVQKLFPNAAIPLPQYASDVVSTVHSIGFRNLFWYDSSCRFGLPPIGSQYLPGVQWFLSGSEHLTLAAKAGNNGDSHNLPLLAGCEECFGTEYRASDIRHSFGITDRFSMELSGAYDCPSLSSFHRLLAHCKETGTLTLTDTVTFVSAQPVTESFVSTEPIRLDGCRAIFTAEGSAAVLSFPDSLTPELLTEEWPSPSGRKTAYLLHLTSAPARKHSISVTVF